MNTNRIYGPRVAQRGRSERFSADPRTLLHLAFSKHVAVNFLQAPASHSTILRRAMAVYVEHLDVLLRATEGDPQIQQEAEALAAANRGAFAPMPCEALEAMEPQPFWKMVKQYDATQPKFIDTMRADLARWAKQPIKEDNDE